MDINLLRNTVDVILTRPTVTGVLCTAAVQRWLGRPTEVVFLRTDQNHNLTDFLLSDLFQMIVVDVRVSCPNRGEKADQIDILRMVTYLRVLEVMNCKVGAICDTHRAEDWSHVLKELGWCVADLAIQPTTGTSTGALLTSKLGSQLDPHGSALCKAADESARGDYQSPLATIAQRVVRLTEITDLSPVRQTERLVKLVNHLANPESPDATIAVWSEQYCQILTAQRNHAREHLVFLHRGLKSLATEEKTIDKAVLVEEAFQNRVDVLLLSTSRHPSDWEVHVKDPKRRELIDKALEAEELVYRLGETAAIKTEHLTRVIEIIKGML